MCLPVGPRCDLCELNTEGSKRCPSAQKVINPKNRKTIIMSEPKVEIKIEETATAGRSTGIPASRLEGNPSVNRGDVVNN